MFIVDAAGAKEPVRVSTPTASTACPCRRRMENAGVDVEPIRRIGRPAVSREWNHQKALDAAANARSRKQDPSHPRPSLKKRAGVRPRDNKYKAS